MKKNLVLGIDTSNYKTSVAVVDPKGEILYNYQQLLKVKDGERGLRQSDASYQHTQNLPPVLEWVLKRDEFRKHIGMVSVSTRPRPLPDSYMPVFCIGEGFARVAASALQVPLHCESHQEGHIEAVKYYSSLKDADRLICFHFSGGTTEAILVDRTQDIYEIVGGTKDLAYGQVLDRVGVALGFTFPCGHCVDILAMDGPQATKSLSKIKVTDGYVNLSGIETQCQRRIGEDDRNQLAADLMFRMSQSVEEMTLQLSEKYDIRNFIYAGGVSCSRYMREHLTRARSLEDLHLAFGKKELSSDNAIGVALLGGKQLWR